MARTRDVAATTRSATVDISIRNERVEGKKWKMHFLLSPAFSTFALYAARPARHAAIAHHAIPATPALRSKRWIQSDPIRLLSTHPISSTTQTNEQPGRMIQPIRRPEPGQFPPLPLANRFSSDYRPIRSSSSPRSGAYSFGSGSSISAVSAKELYSN